MTRRGKTKGVSVERVEDGLVRRIFAFSQEESAARNPVTKEKKRAKRPTR